jgi:hypothetical protein
MRSTIGPAMFGIAFVAVKAKERVYFLFFLRELDELSLPICPVLI